MSQLTWTGITHIISTNIGKAIGIVIISLSFIIPNIHAQHAQISEIIPIHESMIMLRIEEGFVKFHSIGELASEDKTFRYPLQLIHVPNTSNFKITSEQDPGYHSERTPLAVNRKSKGNFFSGRWPNYPVVPEHYIYLSLPEPLMKNASYHLKVNHRQLNLDQEVYEFSFDNMSSRSESVHVNQVGYLPDSDIPRYGYLYHWSGNGGGVDYQHIQGRSFFIIDQETENIEFTGIVNFRGSGHLQENNRNDEPQNYTLADVWECDFSPFTREGRYRLCVDGVGCSYPFSIHPDVYAEVFYHVCRSLYFQRSGINRSEESHPWEFPRQHHPEDGIRIQMTNIRDLGFGIETNSWANEANGIFFENWGWYKDAGDWDAYPKHLYVPNHLLTAYELFPDRFFDGQLDIPESSNGIPDIIDEAAWVLHFLKRSRGISPSGGIIARLNHHPSPPRGVPSWNDQQPWYSTTEDPSSTFFYSGIAAQLANAYLLSDIEAGQDSFQIWKNEAIDAFDWALENSQPSDINNVNFRLRRLLAAIWLYRVTGETNYFNKVKEWNPFDSKTSWDYRWMEVIYGLATCPDIEGLDQDLRQLYIDMVIDHADRWLVQPAGNRNLRMGWEQNAPSFVGLHTTPQTSAAVVAYSITGLKKYRDVILTSIDYNLGTNPLNICWVSGLGHRRPDRGFLHLDGWYFDFEGKNEGEIPPGFIPYAHHVPGRDQTGQPTGPHNNDWATQYLTPSVHNWPIHETWQYNRQSPRTGEFTIHQNQSLTAMVYAAIIPSNVKFNPRKRPKIKFEHLENIMEASPGDTIDMGVTVSDLSGKGEITFKANGVTLHIQHIMLNGFYPFKWQVKDQDFPEWYLTAIITDGRGDGSTAQSQVNLQTTSLDLIKNQEKSVNVWPNPSSGDTIYVGTDHPITNATISIQDLQGRSLSQYEKIDIRTPYPINIHQLQPGPYLIIIKYQNNHESFPFIKQK